MPNNEEVRLRLIEAIMPQATRVGVQDADVIINSCIKLEKYVLNLQESETVIDKPEMPEFLKTSGDKSESPAVAKEDGPRKRQPRSTNNGSKT
jgi:hypothetical protein